MAQGAGFFVVILRYKVPLETIDAFRQGHMAFLDRFYGAGVFLMSGPQAPRQGGVILARCESKEKLEEILAQDPFQSHELATYEVIAFTPTRWHEAVGGFFS
ncbi:MAG: GTP cyclohydrolase [Candidatus Puniceispirillum sp.]|nr:GTP cyclohydrolase [Candidatus Puniceispirillum sp.]